MSQDAFILLAAGRDRPGIVERISGILYETDCNLEDSRMSILGGEFALIVLVTGDVDNLRRAREELDAASRETGLLFQIKPTARSEPPSGLCYRMRVVGMDHPGIVHKVTRILSSKGINLARLDTRVSHAPVTGTPVFSLELEAQIPPDLKIARLRLELEEAAHDENIDIEFHPAE